MKKIIKKTLFWEIFFAIVLILTLTFVAITLSFPKSLKKFFTNEAYQAVIISQNQILSAFQGEYPDYNIFGDPSIENVRNVNHMIVIGERFISSKYPHVELAKEMAEKGRSQESLREKYKTDIEGIDVFYIITKIKGGFIASYLSGNYRDDLTSSLYDSLTFIMAIIVLISLIPAFLSSGKITRPLRDLTDNVERLAQGEWHQDMSIDRDDEIGTLSKSIEDLRLALIRKDEAESEFLQNISHDLKTPVMVIESYTEAIKDEVYPKGDLISSLDTITEETKKLKIKIDNLLMANKLHYLTDKETPKEEIDPSEMLEECINKLSPLKADIEIEYHREPWTITQNRRSWESMIENLMNNQLRYAKKKILIISYNNYIKIQNDGPPLSQEYLKKPFQKFQSGKDGCYGLGLYIAYSVAMESGFDIKALNENNHATFIIEKPLDNIKNTTERVIE